MKKIGQGGNVITMFFVLILVVVILIPTFLIDMALGIMMCIPALLASFIQIKTRSVFVENDKLVINTFFFKKKYLKIEDVKHFGIVFFNYYFIEMQDGSSIYFVKPSFEFVTSFFSLENSRQKKTYTEKVYDMLNKNGNL